ncbi:MAG: acyl carrier protein [Armatimonadota bacterium]|jgi:acyl carrier protein|nr:acyl carrier protein [Armatimonadetes bacterium Uphvl-Ar2]MCE2939365.1 acyl carrier protein [Fimbriimonadaceae bacterium]MCZ8139137.1 acyl carrier protein [Fimbriimonadaceae bacterium]
MSDNILDRVKKVVKEELNVQDEVSESASFTDDLGADSLDVVELVMAIEEEFGIDVPDEDTQGLKTVQDVVDYIKSKQG